MFFIGGFNSVIPYVVYLSLIWAFVVLSFGGKIAALLHKQSDKEILSAKVIYKGGDVSHLRCYHYPSVKLTHNSPAAGIPDLSKLSGPYSMAQFIIRPVSPPLPATQPLSYLFRGPPLSC